MRYQSRLKCIALWGICVLAPTFALADSHCVTVRYRHGLRGYDGSTATTLQRHAPDNHLGGWERFSIGRRVPREGALAESVGLIKFGDLGLPPEAQVVSARLVLYCVKYGTADISKAQIHGLLSNFSVGNRRGPAAAGQSTWNAVRHGEKQWGAPGGGALSDDFIYDGSADAMGTPDDTVAIDNRGRFTFEVTRSFADQLARGKLYGWLIREVSGAENAYAHFATERTPLREKALPVHPELVVELMADEATTGIRPSLGPHLLAFHLGYHDVVADAQDRLRELPFDGAVFLGLSNAQNQDGGGWIANSVFGPDRLAREDYSDLIANMKRIHAGESRLQHNFLRVNLVPGTLVQLDQPYTWSSRPRRGEPVTMWFDDGFEVVVNNLAVAARVAQEAGMKGLLLDWEQYGGGMLNYRDQQDARARGRTQAQTREAVRQRTTRLAQALNEAYPDMTLLIIPGTYHDSDRHDLLNAFMDGLFAECAVQMRIVDGNEQYGNTALEDFQQSYLEDYQETPLLSTVPQAYRAKIEVGFGVWLERHGWSADPAVNNWSAARWQVVLENALVTADTYVWVFNGEGGRYQPDWMTGKNLPEEYIAATWRARVLTRQIRGFAQ